MTTLDVLRNTLHNKRWKNKIRALEADDDSSDEELISEFKQNIIPVKKKEPRKQIVKSDEDNKVPNINHNDITPMFTEIDKYIYKCEWTKLREFHKIVKLKEYVNSLKANKDTKNELIKILEKQLRNKELKNKQVNYTPSNETITKINGVSELDEYQSTSSDSEEEKTKIVNKPKKKKVVRRVIKKKSS